MKLSTCNATHSMELLWQVICTSMMLRLEFFENNNFVLLALAFFSTDPNITSTSRGIPQNFGRHRGGVQKKWLSAYLWNTARLLLRTNSKSLAHCWLVSKSTTLNDPEGSLCTLFQNTCCYLFIQFHIQSACTQSLQSMFNLMIARPAL